MRLFKIGSLRSSGRFGIRVILVEIINPVNQIISAIKAIIWFRRTGLMRSLRIPFLRIIWAVKKHNKPVEPTAKS
uniref:Uncharacterized protein n=1 Tax=viral metagenome TaxID=1070528 RepID=A0A6H2A3N3_9ZZZZ